MTATFTNREGKRIKSISHKNLAYHAKDGGLLVKFGKSGEGKYGPYAFFQVDGDETGDYCYSPDHTKNFDIIEKSEGSWVLVKAWTFENGEDGLVLEDADGNATEPQQEPQDSPPPMRDDGGPKYEVTDKGTRASLWAEAVDLVEIYKDATDEAKLDCATRIFSTLYIQASK